MITPEEFQRIKMEWQKFESKNPEADIKLRCFFCLRDLSYVDAYFSVKHEAAVCVEHQR
jgi:hypothetical protein